ncbi:MAG: hypothetical protein SFV81_28610 [Pirellulaceae bacterium]|nr:hypothetical protein [Pirellulaceae bacterium]
MDEPRNAPKSRWPVDFAKLNHSRDWVIPNVRQKKTSVDDIFELQDGRQVALMELNQRYTYEGFKDGFPTIDFNSKFVALLIADREKSTEPILLIPAETIAEIPGNANCQMLPAVTCDGRFCMYTRENDLIMAVSTLKIVWFQERFAFPIDSTIRERIREVDWDGLTEWRPL